MAAMYAAFYPSILESAADSRATWRSCPRALRTLFGGDFTTPAGYLRSETFSTLGPILFLVFAIGAGSRAIAGEEEGAPSTCSSRHRSGGARAVRQVDSMALTALGLAVVLASRSP